MIEVLVIGLLAYGFYRYRAVNVALRLALFIFAALGLLVLLKVGFVGAFFTALLSIPVNLVKGVFGIFYNLLAG